MHDPQRDQVVLEGVSYQYGVARYKQTQQDGLDLLEPHLDAVKPLLRDAAELLAVVGHLGVRLYQTVQYHFPTRRVDNRHTRELESRCGVTHFAVNGGEAQRDWTG
jgi:hypothetical protein